MCTDALMARASSTSTGTGTVPGIVDSLSALSLPNTQHPNDPQTYVLSFRASSSLP